MIQATSSPSVAYEYAYALPACGIIDGQLGVAERRQARSTTPSRRKERTSAGPAPLRIDLAVGVDLAGRRGADRAEDAGADHGADRQHDQVAGAERPLQPVARILGDVGDRLAGEERAMDSE